MTTIRDSNDSKKPTRPTIRHDQSDKTSVAIPSDVPINPDLDVKVASQGIIKIIKPRASEGWLQRVYSTSSMNAQELANIYNALKYSSFDRGLMLAKLEEKCPDPKLAIEIVIGCALRGPQAMSKLKLSNGRTPTEMGIPGSGMMGTEELSCQRITSATADLAAFYLKLLDIPKRMPTSDCPGWLQFPSAGSIKLPDDLRKLHLDFARRFSEIIGGVFREEIYAQMIANAYLNESLSLFDT